MKTFVTSREFNQSTSEVKKAASRGPVIITDRGRPAHVLLSFTDYQSLTQSPKSIVEMISMPADDEIEFDPPKARPEPKPATF